jgi:hypothetical protein
MRNALLVLALVASGCQSAAPLPASETANAQSIHTTSVPAHQQPLLYVSGVDGTLSMFSYPKRKLVGTISSNYGAQGLCTDSQGNVYVATPEGYEIVVYPHGGLFPIDVISEEQYEVLPVGCAVDPKSGNLAVVNAEGSVEIYKDITGPPQGYDLGLAEAFYDAYDANGDLFVSGQSAGKFALAELPAGSLSSKLISVNSPVTVGSGITLSGSNLLLETSGASGTTLLLTVKISGTSGSIVKKTTLKVEANSTPPEFIVDAGPRGSTFIEPTSFNEDVGFFHYPKGGRPAKTLNAVGTDLVGVAISR